MSGITDTVIPSKVDSSVVDNVSIGMNGSNKLYLKNAAHVERKNGNHLIGSGGTIRVPFYVDNTLATRSVKINLWGLKLARDSTNANQGVMQHAHGSITAGAANSANTGIAPTAVPKFCTIFLDDTEIGSALGVNGKGTTEAYNGATYEYDTTNYTTTSTVLTVKKTVTGINGLYTHLLLDLKAPTTGRNTEAYVKFTYSDTTTANSTTITKTGVDGSGFSTYTVVNPQAAKNVTQMEFYLRTTNAATAAEMTNINYGVKWGVDGTTEWSTGTLTYATALADGFHYLEIRENGRIGGTLIYDLRVD